MTQEIEPGKKSRKSYCGWIIFIIIVLGLTLPFHYIPSALRMFPKDHFTFKHTFITIEDIDGIIEHFNDAGPLEKSAMNNDPFIRTLREQGIIADRNNNSKESNSDPKY